MLACCTLHNLLRDQNPVQFLHQVDCEDPDSHVVIPGEWHKGKELIPFESIWNPRATAGPKNLKLADGVPYYSTRGAVEWQQCAKNGQS